MKTFRWRWWCWLLMGAFISCSGSSGSGCSDCSGMAVVPYPTTPPPGGELQANVVRARLTQSTLDFLAAHIEPLLGQFLDIQGRQANFVFTPDLIPPGGPLSVSAGSTIGFDLDNLTAGLSLTWLDDDASGRPGLRFAIRDADLFMDIKFATDSPDLQSLTAECRIQSAPGLAAISIAELRFDMRIEIDTSGAAPAMVTTTENVVIDLGGATDDVVLAMRVTTCDGSSIDPVYNCSMGTVCSQADVECEPLCNLVDQLFTLGGFLVQIIEPVLNPIPCTIDADCPLSGQTCHPAGFCDPDNSLGGVLASFISDALTGALGAIPLGIETAFDLQGLLGPVFRNAQPMNLKIAASNNISIAGQALGRGLDLGLSGGITTTSPAACALDAVPPDLTLFQGPAPDLEGWIEVAVPGGSGTQLERYHLAITLSQALLNQATWSAFQSGLLCFNLDAEDVEVLAGNVFAFTAGLLQTFDARLAGIAEPDAPMLASLRATRPPTIRLGAGHLVAAGVQDPMIEIAINDLELGIFMLMDDAQHRVSGLKADLVLTINMERTPQGSLELIVTDIALVEIRQIYNEMVPASDLSDLFELIVDLAVDAMLGDSLRIEINLSDSISTALGVPLELRINTIRRDLGPTLIPHLSIYATLCDENDVANPNNLTCYIDPSAAGSGGGGSGNGVSQSGRHFVRLGSYDSLYTAADPVRFPPPWWLAAPSGRAELRIDSTPVVPLGWEYQTRVDGGQWNGFRAATDGTLTVTSARLRTLGRHTIEVRARQVGKFYTRSEAIPFSFWVDPELPRVEVTRVAERFIADGFDLGSGRAVDLFARTLSNGEVVRDWWHIDAGVLFDVEMKRGLLEVIGRDLAGNVSPAAVVDLGAAAATTEQAVYATDSSGCASTRAEAWGLLAALALMLRRRRS